MCRVFPKRRLILRTVRLSDEIGMHLFRKVPSNLLFVSLPCRKRCGGRFFEPCRIPSHSTKTNEYYRAGACYRQVRNRTLNPDDQVLPNNAAICPYQLFGTISSHMPIEVDPNPDDLFELIDLIVLHSTI